VDHAGVICVAPLGWAPTFLIQNVGDAGGVVSGLMKFPQACDQSRIARHGGRSFDRPDDPVHGLVSTLPMTFEDRVLRVIDRFDQHPFEEQASDLLTFLLGGRRGAPKIWQIICQIADGD
jgi:hypothetical protein